MEWPSREIAEQKGLSAFAEMVSCDAELADKIELLSPVFFPTDGGAS